MIAFHPEAALHLRFPREIADNLPIPKKLPTLLARYDGSVGDDNSVDGIADLGTPVPESASTDLYFTRCALRFGCATHGIDVRLPRSRGISKRHFTIWCTESGVWRVENHGSNGVIVNGVVLNTNRPRWSLNPLERNSIVPPYARFEAVIFKSLEDTDNIPFRPGSNSQPNVDSPRGTSVSTTGSTSTIRSEWLNDFDTLDDPTEYIVLEHPKYKLPWSPSSCLAIHAPTAGVFGVVQFRADERRSLDKFFLEHSIRTLQHPYLLPLINIESKPTHPPLLVFECLKLPQSFEDLDQNQIAAATRQVVHVLDYLHGKKICHGNIDETFIAYTSAGHSNSFTITLTGLWKRWLALSLERKDTAASASDLRQDVRAAAIVLMKSLRSVGSELEGPLKSLDAMSLHGLECPVDPLLSQALESMYGDTGDTSAFHEHMIQITDGNDNPLFENTMYAQEFNIETRNSGKDLSRDDVIIFWESHIRSVESQSSTRESRLAELKWLRQPRSKIIARKAFLAMMKRHEHYMVENLPADDSDKISPRITIRLPWIPLLDMVNVTRLIAVVGICVTQRLPPDGTIEVRGINRNSGIYVKYAWLKDVLPDELRKRILRPSRQSTERGRKLEKYIGGRFIFFSTGLPWSTLVVMRRFDYQALWEPFLEKELLSTEAPRWLSIDESIAKCKEYNLRELQEAIEVFTRADSTDPPEFCSIDPLDDSRLDDGHASDTSVATDQEDPWKFRRKRSKRKLHA